MSAQLIHKAMIASVVGSLTLATSVSVNALNITDVPLVVAQAAPPNIMILFDTSGSMEHVTPGGALGNPGGLYDPNDATWDLCPTSTNIYRIPSNRSLHLEIHRGFPRIDLSGTNIDTYYSVDTSSPNTVTLTGPSGSSTHRKVCFLKDETYQAVLTTDGSVGGSTGFYSGHYLNFYFGSVQDGSWTAAGQHHPGQPSRIDVGKVVIDNFISARADDSINLGMARFDGNNGNGDGDGARIQQPVALLTSTYKTTLSLTVNQFLAGGSTPLAESLIDIGIYFTGNPGEQLRTHPNPDGLTGGTMQDVTTVFPRIGGNIASPNNPSFRSTIPSADRASPIDQASFCEKNYTILMTDGQPTNDSTNIGSVLSDYDGDCSGGGCSSQDRKNSADPSDYLDDVAQALYEMDLRPDIDDRSGGEYLNNLGTYIIGFADPGIQDSQLFKDVAAQGSGGKTLPFFPDDQDELDATFEQIIADIFSQEGSVASVSFNSGQLASDSAVFQAKFHTNPWSGNLVAFNLDDSTGVIETPFAWDAAVTLDQRLSPAGNYTATTGRNVFTFDPTPAAGTADGVSLSLANWANLPGELKSDLYAGVDIDGDADPADDPEAMLLLQYLLGDETNEGATTTNYRIRNTLETTPPGHPNGAGLSVRNRLGDIVNSTPVFVGATELNWPDWSSSAPVPFGAMGNSYSHFQARTNIVNRTPVIYVGSNDGMLHGFNAEIAGTAKGEEVFAYVPSSVFSAATDQGLHYLAQHDYAHRFFVDLTPAVSDVFISNGTAVDWRTVLVGGLRGGGKGLFALDITDPAAYGNTAVAANTRAANAVLWEFTHPELGFTFSQPTIVKMANGRWAAITGNGYNSTSGAAQLFIIYLDGGVDGVWTLGTDYLVISTGAGPNNGLSTPRAADTDGDQVVDRIYAGDLLGNLWTFDVSSIDPVDPTTPWGVAFGGAPLFTACSGTPCTSSNRQPITSAPFLVRNTAAATLGNEPNVLVLFGTGQFLEPTDPTAAELQSFYTVWDAAAGGFTRSNLVQNTISQVTVSPGNFPARTISGTTATYNATTKGWFMDLPDTGERVVSDAQIIGETVFFNTIIPDNTTCSPGGTGWLMSVDFISGLAPTGRAIYDGNKDGTIDSNDVGYVGEFFGDSLPAKSGFLGDRQYTPGSDGSISSRPVVPGSGENTRRLFWEEVYRR